jgi:hypothetical protein
VVITTKNKLTDPIVNQFHRPIGMIDGESDVDYDTRMLMQMGFVPA